MAQVCSGGTAHRAHWVEGASGLTCLACRLPVGDGEGRQTGAAAAPLRRAASSTEAYDAAGNWLIAIWCLAALCVICTFLLAGSTFGTVDGAEGDFSASNGLLAAIPVVIFWVPWIGLFTVLRTSYAPR